MIFYKTIKQPLEFIPDLHPIRNLYLTCSDICGYSSLYNFDWSGQNIINKIPNNVPFGSMLYSFQNTSLDYFRCGNKTLSNLTFTLRDSHGNIINMASHLSFSKISMLEN